MRPIATIFAAASLVIGIGIAWLIASSTISWVEASEKAELEQAFYAGGIGWASVKADGFVVTLRGEAETAAEQARAAKIAGLIFGENLIDETTLRGAVPAGASPEPPFVEILKNGNDFSFLGRMPGGETTRVFDAYVRSLGPEARVSNVTEPTTAAPENWLPAFEFALRLAPQVEQAILNVSPGEVSLEAVALSPNWKQGFVEMAENIRPEGVRLGVDISAPRPVIAPYRFMLDVATPDSARCAAQDEAEAGEIATRVEQLIGVRVKCDIGIGAPSTRWREAVDAGLTALTSLGGGRLEIIDADVTLVSPDGVGLAQFETVARVLRFSLPDGFSLTAQPSEVPPRRAVAESRPESFTATLDSAGNAVVEGAVKDTLTREVVMRFSEAKFGYGRVEDRMWLDDTLPDGWQVRVFKLIEALAVLNEGRAEMTPDRMDISGDAGFEDPDAELGKLLAGVYAPGETTLDISYTAPAGGEDGRGLDPRLCVSRITKLLSENRIVFAPSSAVISDPSMPTIAAIAAILTQCRDARIEIGGHTDSQGREEMNLALSQGRADAVLDALLAQNLLLGEITARGYGESEPIADNGTEAGRAANRRIEFKLLRDAPIVPVATDNATGTDAPETAADDDHETAERVVIENFRRPARRAPSN